MLKRCFSLMLAALLALSLTACGGKATTPQESSPAEQGETDPGQTDTKPQPGQADTKPEPEPVYHDLEPHRQVLLDNGAICGVVFIGPVEDESVSLVQSQELRFELLKRSGYLEDFNFMTEIPAQRIAEAEVGYELYCFFPLADDTHVTVSGCDIDTKSGELVDTGEILLDSDSGAPFLVHCNSSDLYSNVRVTVTDSQGATFTWEPHLSLQDGTVDIPEDNTLLYDATVYPER